MSWIRLEVFETPLESLEILTIRCTRASAVIWTVPTQTDRHMRRFPWPTTLTAPLDSSELQSSRAAQQPAGGAAVRWAASGAGTDAPAGVQGRGSPTAAPRPRTGEEENPTSHEKTPPSRPATLTQEPDWTSRSVRNEGQHVGRLDILGC